MENIKIGHYIVFVVFARQPNTWYQRTFGEKYTDKFIMDIKQGKIVSFDDKLVVIESEGKLYYRKKSGLYNTVYQAQYYINETLGTDI